MRVSSLPSLYGEAIVCRLMGNEGVHKNLLELGMDVELQEKIAVLLKRPYGLITICGPTMWRGNNYACRDQGTHP